jgi:hypothetical protein
MNRWLLRVALAVVLGCGASRASAQQPGPIQPVVHEMGQPQARQAPQPAVTNSAQSAAPCAAEQKPEPAQPGFCMRCLNSIGLGCAASHDTVGCGSCYAQYIFVFGSCRQFFGEPCIPWGPDTLPGKFSTTGGAGGAGGGCSKCGW